MKILLLSTGSISTYLSAKLVERLETDGHEITQHLITEHANSLWSKSGKYLEYLKSNTTCLSVSEECSMHFGPDKSVVHIDAVNEADICVVCPADFNIVGKMANGIADDVVSSTLAAWLGSEKPLYVAEAMNTMMYSNPIHQQNIERLKNLSNVSFIMPTVKKLACGDYGIGGLADINAIANIVEGHRWVQPISDGDIYGCGDLTCLRAAISFSNYLPTFNEPGSFGAKRKHDIHEGVDIYCTLGARVCAVEDGEVVDAYQFTGANANCGWWRDTWCIKVKGKSGIVTYGELMMPSESEVSYPEVGAKVKAGDIIGIVGQVLPDEKLRSDIRNHNTCMLHIELRTENCRFDGWKLGSERDKRLLDPTPYLHLCKSV